MEGGKKNFFPLLLLPRMISARGLLPLFVLGSFLADVRCLLAKGGMGEEAFIGHSRRENCSLKKPCQEGGK